MKECNEEDEDMMAHLADAKTWPENLFLSAGLGGTVLSESALKFEKNVLLRVRVLPPAPCPDGGTESLRSPCCGLHHPATQISTPSPPQQQQRQDQEKPQQPSPQTLPTASNYSVLTWAGPDGPGFWHQR
ncbi:hypothetical protein PoB_002986500 [Plakobranchus ocellatus]|uniref:Uncharacterized protein n=1 Tax=Plakobranchus ocellatus TaxID=259542 RepID=A0AAV4A981_9GAST|nr:hypothetical protein PoB_002986500 [Plakobranchus ocellatus]